MASEQLVRCEVDDAGVATLTLDDPQERNAWSLAMEEQYFGLLDELADRPAVRAVVLTGAGTTFCPGLAMSRLATVAGQRGIDLSQRRSAFTPRRFPKPMIAAINGACAGFGLVHALQCDVRFAARGAKMTTAFARRGLAAEYNLAWTLPRLVGVEHALDLLMSARTFLAEEAHAMGLVSRLSEPDDVLADAQAYARELATRSAPIAMAVIRDLVYDALDLTFDEALRRCYTSMYWMNQQDDLAEGVASFREKRDPAFASLPSAFDVSAVTGAVHPPFPHPGPSDHAERRPT
jgi:enoyl-CoA hydratase/carnithine racemase